MSDPMMDAAAEFTRQEEAQAFELPDLGAPMFDDVGESPARQQHSHQSGRRAASSIHTLEDLYSAYPEIGAGEWKLRVSRTFPKTHDGCATAGFLGELYDRISLGEFKNKYGGGAYVIGVMKPTGDNEGTLSDYKQIVEVRFRISGDPNLAGAPAVSSIDDKKNIMSQQAAGVEIARMQIDQRERDRLHQDRLRSEEKLEKERERARSNDSPHMYETTKRIVDDVREVNQAQLTFWATEVDRLRAENSARNQENKKLSEELIDSKNKAQSTDRVIESKLVNEQRAHYEQRIVEIKESLGTQITELRARFDDERRRMQDEQSKKIEALNDDNRRQVAEITRRHDEQFRTYESAQALERERVREAAKDRIDQVEKSKAQELAQLRDTQESRLEDLRRSTEREIRANDDASKREIESIRTSERASAEFAKQTAENRKDQLEAERNRIREEMKELKRDNAELRTKLHKEPLQYLAECKEVATNMLGLVDASEVEQPVGEQSTMAQVFGLAKQAFDSAPAVLDKIMQARQQNQGASQQQMEQMHMQQMAQQQAMWQQQQMAQRALPQAQQQQQQQGRYIPPGGQQQQSAYTPPPFGGATNYNASATPVPFAPYAATMTSPIQPAGPAAPVAVSTTPFDSPVGTGDSQAAAHAPAPVMQNAPAQPQQATPEQAAAVTAFFQQLESAVANRVVGPDMFAKALVDQAGLDQVAALLQRYTPADIIETARQLSADSQIDTRHGHTYVEAVWKHAQSLVRGAA